MTIRKTYNKKLIILFMLLYIILAFSNTAYAHFSSVDENYGEELNIISADEEKAIIVSNEAALRIAAQNSVFNDMLPVSQYQERRYIKLGADIKLNSPLAISADCNLDFGGKKLDLNGNSVELNNTYYGNLIIINGEIINSHSNPAYFDIITPNAVVEYNVVDNNSLIRLIAYNTTQTLNAALDRAEEILAYGDAANNFHSDIMLLQNFYGYPMEFEYITSNPNVISVNGKVNILNFETTTVHLELIVSLNEQTASRVFPVNITDVNNYEAWADIGLELFDNFFSLYASGPDEYTIYSDIILPLSEDYIYDGTNTAYYEYRSLTEPNEFGEEISGDIIINQNYATLKSRLIAEEVMYFEVTCSYGVYSASKIYTVKSQSYNDIYQLANIIVQELFQNQINVYEEEDLIAYPSGYTEFELKSASEYAHLGVTDLSYSLINNDGTYVINQGVLQVASEMHPSEIQVIFLQMNFTFGTSPVKVDIPIVFHDSGGNVHDRFLPYYVFFNGLLAERTNYNRTYTSFEMPFCYFQRMPIIKFTIYEDDNPYMGDAVTLNFKTSSSESVDFNALSAQDLSALINDPNARWEIKIHWDKLGRENMNIGLKYHYTFNLDSGWEWSSHEIYYSSFLIPGIITKIDIPDDTLYEKIFNVFHPETPDFDIEKHRILASRITRRPQVFSGDPLAFTIELNQGESISTYKGLELLTGVTELRLRNVGLRDSDLVYVRQLTQLNYLDISNNLSNITDISTLNTLTNLRRIDVSNNRIRVFYVLESFPYLDRADIYGNQVTFTFWGTTYPSILYGSTGYINRRVYMRLRDRDVKVFWVAPNANQDNYFKAEDLHEANYHGLNSIVYQYRLPQGVDAGLIYATLSTNANHYSVNRNTGSSYTNEISFGTEEDAFYIQFTITRWWIVGLLPRSRDQYYVYFEVEYYE